MTMLKNTKNVIKYNRKKGKIPSTYIINTFLLIKNTYSICQSNILIPIQQFVLPLQSG